MTELPDYESWLVKDTWTLAEAVLLIQGEEPYTTVQICDPDKQVIGVEDSIKEYKNCRTFKKACDAILKAELKVEYYDLTNPISAENLGSYLGSGSAGSLTLKIRDFLDWCVASGAHIHPKLEQYTNYDYWIEKARKESYWTFNEAVTILYSLKCPFPHEIGNVFEDEEMAALAKKVKNNLNRIGWEEELGTYEISIMPFGILTWAKKNKMPYPIVLEGYRKKELMEYEELNIWRMTKSDYLTILQYDSLELDEALLALLGAREGTYYPDRNNILISLKVFFWRSHQAGTVKLLKEYPWEGQKAENVFEKACYLNGIISPQELIRWAMTKDIIIPSPLKEAMDELNFLGSTSVENESYKKQEKLRPNQIDKQLCQAVAKTLWDEHPAMTIEDMKKHKAIQQYANGKSYGGKNTLRDWLREVDPRPSEQKTGMPKKIPV